MRILQVIPYFYPAQAFRGSVKVAYDAGKKLTGVLHVCWPFSDAVGVESVAE